MRVSTLSWGVVFIGIGAFFLAINTGHLDHYVWIKLISLWPVVLVAIGIALIFSRTRLKFLALLSPLLLALTFVYVAASEWGDQGYFYRYDRDYSTRYTREVFEYSISPDPEVARLNIEMDFGFGELWIGATSKEIFSGDFEYRVRKPDVDYDVVGGEGRLSIKSRDYKRFNIFRRGQIKNDSRIYIADYLPLELDLDIGAAEVDIDLADHALKKLNLDTGAARIDLRLGCKSNDLKIDIDSGASDIHIYVPTEMALQIDSDVALSSTNFKSAGLNKYHGKYRSDNFGSAACTAYIDIDSGVSEIKISYY